MSTIGTDAATRHPGRSPEHQPRGDRDEDDLRVAEDRRETGTDLLDGVMPEHEVHGEEGAGDPRQAGLATGTRAVSALLIPRQEGKRRQGIGAAEDRRARG